ncbi:MAG: hypothetical protein ACKOUU_14695 [Acinetobacter tjernbergiae]
MPSEMCNCFEPCYSNKKWRSELKTHPDTQDRSIAEWRDLLCLIDEAANDQREVFDPAKDLGTNAWQRISTLPSEIAKLKHVKHLLLYGSNLTWLPPEIGDMESLVEFTPYTSYRLHWFPFEITYCKNLKESTVSTRALYGNYKFRPPFPLLKGNPVDLYRDRARCSVCRAVPTDRDLNQIWLSLKVATDVVPLLVHTCSKECLQQLPKGHDEYLAEPHKGGLGLAQPPKHW